MDRLIYRTKIMRLWIFTSMVLIISCFLSPIFAIDQKDQIFITVDKVVCPEEFTVDLSQTSSLEFDFVTNPEDLKTSTIYWELEIPDYYEQAPMEIDGKGLATFYDVTDKDYPVILTVTVDNIVSSPVSITIVDKTPSVKLEGLSSRYDPLYVSNEEDYIDLLDNLILTPSNATINPNDLLISVSNKRFGLRGSLLLIDEIDNDQTTVLIQSIIDPSISILFDVYVTDPVDMTGIKTVSELNLSTSSKPANLEVELIPFDTTQGLIAEFSYVSSDTDVVEVDNLGNVTPHEPGTAIITTKATVGTETFETKTSVKVVETIPIEGIKVKQTLIELTRASGGKNTEQLEVTLDPVDTTQRNLTYTSLAPTVANVDDKGLVTAINNGKTTVTITDEAGHQALVVVNVSDSKIVADYVTVAAMNPDEFTVIAKNVHLNSALKNNYETINNVSCFAFSSKDLSDINAKFMNNESGTHDWKITIPVNHNSAHEYFYNASKINIHIYASDSLGSTGELVGFINYNYVNHGTSPTNLSITPYAQNLGFITPSFNQDSVAGTIGQNRQLEGIRLSTPINGLELEYSVHAADLGWMDPVTSGTYAGTMGQNRRIEAIRIKLTGNAADQYQVQYRVHMQNFGWGNWVSDNEIAGTTGQGIQLEAIQARIIKK